MTRFRIDPDRSYVAIEATSSVHSIHSRTDGLEGWLDLELDGDGAVDLGTAPAAHLELPVTRLRAGNPLEEAELKRRIDARRFPTITGELTTMAPAAEPGRYRVTGDVTFRGVTRACEDEISLTLDDAGEIRITGTSVFDVRDFGMEPPRILLLRVHPDVTVTIDVVATSGDPEAQE